MSIRVQTLTRSAISGLSMLLACFLALAYFVVSQGASQAATVNDIVKDVKLSGVSSSTKLGVGTMMQVDFTIDGTGRQSARETLSPSKHPRSSTPSLRPAHNFNST